MEMEINEDDRQGDNSTSGKPKLENASMSEPSDTSTDSSCSIASSSKKENKPNNLNKSSISELVGKSKKAAFSLWTLLHAKVGR